jgi:hypothetical protein
MNLNKTKIRIKDEEHYELVQYALYDKEIYWSIGGIMSYIPFFECLFIDNDGITYSSDEYGIQHPYKEITLEDILACEIQYEIY